MSPERFTLRRPSESDVDALVRLRGDQAVRRHLGGAVSGDRAVTKARELIGSYAHFVVEVASGELAGLVSLTPRGDDLELSYEFFPDYWGRGMAREACAALLYRSVLLPARLIAVTQRSNERSRRLLHALGFRQHEEFEEFGAVQVLYVHPG